MIFKHLDYLIFSLAILGLAPRAAHAEGLEAPETWAVVAGVLAWEDPGLAAFPKAHRKDEALFDTLGALGVPASQRTLLLDNAATRTAVAQALTDIVARAPEGSTVLFYYAGHGVKDDAGRVIFATADIRLNRLDRTGLAVDDLPRLLRGFKGRRILLLADCCYSGGLEKPARVLGRTYEVAALTSAEASNISTSDWTYTQTLLDALKGRALLDPNADGRLTFSEVADEVADAMKHREQQRAGFANFGWPTDWVVAVVGATEPPRTSPPASRRLPSPFAVRDWVLAPRLDRSPTARPDIARVTDVGDGQLEVEFFDYADATRVWVKSELAKDQTFPTKPVGSAVRVRWQGKVYDAKVLEVSDGFMLVTYPGYDRKWDEWVTATRLVEVAPSAKKQAKVRWKGAWYDAVVNSERDGKWCVSYVGYDATWDECVGRDRIRF